MLRGKAGLHLTNCKNWKYCWCVQELFLKSQLKKAFKKIFFFFWFLLCFHIPGDIYECKPIYRRQDAYSACFFSLIKISDLNCPKTNVSKWIVENVFKFNNKFSLRILKPCGLLRGMWYLCYSRCDHCDLDQKCGKIWAVHYLRSITVTYLSLIEGW